MEASEKFSQFERYIRTLCNIIGFDVMTETWKKSYRTYMSIFLCSQYLILMVYSLIIASDTFELFKSLSFLGFFFQCSLKMYYTIQQAPQYAVNFCCLKEAIYERHSKGTLAQKTTVTRIIDLLVLVTKAISVLYTSSLFIFSLYPAYMYFVVHVKVPIFPLYIPGINIYSAYGYGITNSFHMLIAVYGLFGALTSDIVFIMFVVHFVTYGGLFKIECEQFDQDLSGVLQHCEWRTAVYKTFCRQRMRAIYQYHQSVIFYLESMQECYRNICVVQVASCSLSTVFNLFLALTTDWYATYGFIVISVFQLFVYCLMGTVMQIMNERMIDYISNLPWYMLPTEEQKQFKFMLARSQLSAEIMIRSVGPMNMETFTDIMQKMYSAFAMMYSFLVDLG
ncbi:putative odorant receptor 83c [Anopheles gambiae]|uniref:putative odorant receptor 83c n=1 Tax=Anopheles gambiae TaxID=7165 RepID=UPI002AC99D2B|nr:putative odorant receptor 83c [Anopheles gambiae]